VNGNWIGCHRNATELVSKIKEMRRKGILPQEVSIVRDIRTKEIRFLTDSGRV
jgi:DNA-directed RNA polymerase II subunit RPB2